MIGRGRDCSCITVRRAFTLIEVLLALGILLALTGSVYAFVDSIMTQRDRVTQAASDQQIAGAIIERIETDVLATLAGSDGIGAGIVGTNATLTLLTRGVTPPLQGSAVGVPLGDLQLSRFEFDPISGELHAARRDALDEQAQTRMELLTNRLERVRFRYYKGRSWVSSFDSRTSGLPAAIEVALWFRAEDDEGAPDELEALLAMEDEFGKRSARGRDDFEDRRDEEPSEESPPAPRRRPDRLRVIVIPDGPDVGWRGGP